MDRQPRKTSNPFYAALVLFGILFTVTACAYVVMTIHQAQPTLSAPTDGLISFLDNHGTQLMMVELGLLAIAACAAIGTDGYWSRSEASTQNEAAPAED